MTEAIIVALIAAVGSVLGQWLISRKQNQEKAIAEAKRDERLEMRLTAVEEKLDRHNSYGDKFGEIQKDIAVIKTEIAALQTAKGV